MAPSLRCREKALSESMALLIFVSVPAALVFGILGIRYRKRYPTAGGLGDAVFGVVVGGFGLVAFLVLLVLGIIVGMNLRHLGR